MAVLITGGNGFLGSYVVERARARWGAANVIAPRSRNYDLFDAEDLRDLFSKTRPELVIHLAATCGGIGANRAQPATYFYGNLIMGTQLMEAARHFDVKKFVAVGTVCSYPKFCPAPFKEDDIWNGYPEETNAPYGLAKKMLLVQAQAYRQQYGFNAIYLIPANLYGPRDNFNPDTSHVIPALIRKCMEAVKEGRDKIDCWGTGSATREFLHADDCARGIIAAAEHYDKPEPVNLGTGAEISIRELAQRIAQLTGFTGRMNWDTSQPDGQPRRVLDISRAAQEFDFRARIGLDDGLKDTINWYRTKKNPSAKRLTGCSCSSTVRQKQLEVLTR